jgi:hypothetical protein
MKRILCLFLLIVTILTGCNQSGNNQNTQASQLDQIKIILNGEAIVLTQPALLQKDVVYLALDDFGSLPGIKA